MGMVGVLLAAGGASRFRSSAEQQGLAVAHKLIAPLRGETVFSWSLRNLLDAVPQTNITEVIVVQGALDLSGLVEAAVGSRNLTVRLVTNLDWAQGQATSLALAVDTINTSDAAIDTISTSNATINISNAAIEPSDTAIEPSDTAIEPSDAAIEPSDAQFGKNSDVATKPSVPEGRSMVVGLGDQPFIPAETWAAVANAPVEQQIVVATYGGLRRNPVRIDGRWWGEIPRTGDEGARPLLRNRAEFVHELPCNGDPADIDTVEDLLRWS